VNHVPVRGGRLRDAAAKRGVPQATILLTVAVVVLTYLAGKLDYRIRDVPFIIVVAGFVSLILNPLVVALQRWGIRRRGWAVALVAAWMVLVFVGLLAAFGYPLAHGVTHFSQRLPTYVQAAEHGRGWIGHLVTRFHLQAWVNRNAPPSYSPSATRLPPASSPAAAFVACQQIENHVLDPVVMSRTATSTRCSSCSRCGRDVHRRLGRRLLRQLRGRPASDPGRRRPAGHHPGTVARHRAAAIAQANVTRVSVTFTCTLSGRELSADGEFAVPFARERPGRNGQPGYPCGGPSRPGTRRRAGAPGTSYVSGHSLRQCHDRHHHLSIDGRLGVNWRKPREVNVMSGSRFWAKNQDRRPESENADGVLAGTLTATDRCDRCGGQAYVRVLLPSRLELLFCAHHNRQYATALAKIAMEIRDETDRLARVAA